MSDIINEEKTFWESIKDTKFMVQWISVLIIMGIINIILNSSYGPLKDSFFCANLTGNIITSKRLMLIYTLLVYTTIVGVREWTRQVDYENTTVEERTEGIKDFFVYIIIVLVSFVYASSYIRRKFNTGSGSTNIGGGGNEGILGDSISKISSTGFGTLTIYIGLLIVLVNVITNSYQYLKNKRQNQKNKFLRAIYFSQIANMIIFLITSFFIAGFGCSVVQSGNTKMIIYAMIKWIIHYIKII